MYTRGDVENPWTWANSIIKGIWGPNNPYCVEVKVKTVRLSKYINRSVDLLKLDIEGAEQEVLFEIKDKLRFVKNIVFEFHGSKYNRNSNDILKITELLLRNSFEVTITPINLLKNHSVQYRNYVKEAELEYYIVRATKNYNK